MVREIIRLKGKRADGYVIPLGPVNIVFAVTDTGMVGCGAFDVRALDAFSYPAATVKSAGGGPIASVEDLLSGIVKLVNSVARSRGVAEGMAGREALERM